MLSCGQSVSARAGKRYTEIGLFNRGLRSPATPKSARRTCPAAVSSTLAHFMSR
jgi:hypothetical protein